MDVVEVDDDDDNDEDVAQDGLEENEGLSTLACIVGDEEPMHLKDYFLTNDY